MERLKQLVFHKFPADAFAVVLNRNFDFIPQIRGLNKIDRVPPGFVEQCIERWNGIALCARDQTTLMPLIEAMAQAVEKQSY